jgi:glycerate-2-kinase
MNYLLLARGESIGTARVLAISADQRLVGHFIRELMDEEPEHGEPVQPPLHLVSGGEATDR